MKFVFTLVLALALATTAFASTSSFTACTADKKSVTLVVDYNDELAAQHPVVAHIGKAFSAAAERLNAEELQFGNGFKAFLEGLDQQDYDAINHLGGAPTITGNCK